MTDNAPIPPIANAYWLSGGRVLAGEYPGAKSPHEALERLGRFLDAGVTSFVDLTSPADKLTPYDGLLAEEAERRGITVRYARLTIRDMDVPDAAHMSAILDHIDAEVESGQVVYVHCWGGVGRTGTVLGCHFVRGGCNGEEALERVARHWTTMSDEKRSYHPESPQTDPQRAFVRQWAETPA
jgi:hypothetical protein